MPEANLLPGTLDLLILSRLARGSIHGFGIAEYLHGVSDAFHVEEGSLYPALHRLERQGWLASRWKLSENNQRAKYYSLTAAGKRQLASEQSKWELLVKAISGVLDPAR